MYFENELTGTLTSIEFLLAVSCDRSDRSDYRVKLLLYRRRVVEYEEVSPAWADHQPSALPRAQAGFLTTLSRQSPRPSAAHGPQVSCGIDWSKPPGFLLCCIQPRSA